MDPTVFFDMSYGVYVVSAYDAENGRSTGCTANAVMQVTAEPETVAVSINHVNHTHACIEKEGKFAVSILAETSKPLIIGTFGFRSGRDFDKFAGFDAREVDGIKVLNDACGYFVCEVVQKMETATHTVFLGKVIAGERLQKAAPMTYAYYHNVIKKKKKKNAPTYVKES